MIHADQDLRGKIGRAGRVPGELGRVDQGAGAGRDRLGGLPAHELGGGGADHGPQVGLGVERAAQLVLAGEGGEALDEGLVDILVHIDPLDGAARLAGVEEGAVRQVFDRVVEVRIGPHIGRVLAAQLEADAEEPPGRRLLDAGAAGHRAGEGDEIHFGRSDDLRGRLVRQVQHLEDAVGQAGLGEGLGDALAAPRCLAGMLQDHRVAGHDRGHDRIDRRQIGVVPRRDRQYHAERNALDVAQEAFLLADLDVGQRLLGDGDHVARALLEAGHLAAAEADRPAHLPGELLRVLVGLGDEGVDRLGTERRALREWRRRPGLLRRGRRAQTGVDLPVAGIAPLEIDRAVDRRDGLKACR